MISWTNVERQRKIFLKGNLYKGSFKKCQYSARAKQVEERHFWLQTLSVNLPVKLSSCFYQSTSRRVSKQLKTPLWKVKEVFIPKILKYKNLFHFLQIHYDLGEMKDQTCTTKLLEVQFFTSIFLLFYTCFPKTYFGQ